MKMKLILLFILLTVKVYSQTEVNKTIAFQQGQTISMHFDYPELIKVSTWDKNEISITGTVTINGGENDDGRRHFAAADILQARISNATPASSSGR